MTRPIPRTALVVVSSAGLLFAAAAPAVAAQQHGHHPGHHHSAHHASRDAEVTIVHGIRGLTANVRLDGKTVLTSFAPRRSAGPLALSPGAHHLVVLSNGSPVLKQTFRVAAREHMTAALGLDAAGKPALYTFDDALRSAAAAPATLVFRSVASTNGLEARVDGHADGVLQDGRQLSHRVNSGKHTVSLVDQATGKTVVPSQRVPTQAGAVTALYLIGSASKSDLGWVATSFRPANATPRAVQTGNSGLAATPDDAPWLPLSLLAIGSVGLLGALAWRRRPRGGAAC